MGLKVGWLVEGSSIRLHPASRLMHPMKLRGACEILTRKMAILPSGSWNKLVRSNVILFAIRADKITSCAYQLESWNRAANLGFCAGT